MKKKIALILAIIFSLGAFALVACTDKKDQPRELDSVEQSIVGTWKSSTYDTILTFNSDGTYAVDGITTERQKFKHTAYGVDGMLGRYEIIDYSTTNKLALFDAEPDRLYAIFDGNVRKDAPYERQ